VIAAGLEALLQTTVAAIEAAGFRYALIGGLARNAWTEPRATKDVDLNDVDLNVLVETVADRDRLLSVTAGVGLEIRRTRPDPGSPIPDIVLLRAAADPLLRVDLLVSKTDFERQVVDRAIRSVAHGVPCNVARLDDLLVYKIVAGRTQDAADVEALVRARELSGQEVDWKHVERWCGEFGFENEARAVRAKLGH
jgi:predicted nucleotidyltransferase